MKWAHLPSNGGIYAQKPELLDRFYYILQRRSRYEAEKESQRLREKGGGSGVPRPSRAATPRGRRR